MNVETKGLMSEASMHLHQKLLMWLRENQHWDRGKDLLNGLKGLIGIRGPLKLICSRGWNMQNSVTEMKFPNKTSIEISKTLRLLNILVGFWSGSYYLDPI